MTMAMVIQHTQKLTEASLSWPASDSPTDTGRQPGDRGSRPSCSKTPRPGRSSTRYFRRQATTSGPRSPGDGGDTRRISGLDRLAGSRQRPGLTSASPPGWPAAADPAGPGRGQPQPRRWWWRRGCRGGHPPSLSHSHSSLVSQICKPVTLTEEWLFVTQQQLKFVS